MCDNYCCHRRNVAESDEISVTERLVFNLPNKLNHTLCNNWRGVTLLTISNNVFRNVDIFAISTAIGSLVRPENRQALEKGHVIATIFKN